MWQVGTSPGYKQINERREKISREHFKHSQRAFKMEQWLCPGGKKWSCWYVYIRRKGSLHCHHQWFSLSRQDFDSWLYLNNNSFYVQVNCHGWYAYVNIFLLLVLSGNSFLVRICELRGIILINVNTNTVNFNSCRRVFNGVVTSFCCSLYWEYVWDGRVGLFIQGLGTLQRNRHHRK